MEFKDIYEKHTKCVYICDRCLFETSSKTKLLLHEDNTLKCARMQIYRLINEDLEIKKINKKTSSNLTMEKLIIRINDNEHIATSFLENKDGNFEKTRIMSTPMITRRKKRF